MMDKEQLARFVEEFKKATA